MANFQNIELYFIGNITIFIAEKDFGLKNRDVSKKVELNILKIGQVMAILGSKKGFQKFWKLSRKFCLARENCYNSANFKDNLNFFFLYMITDESPQLFNVQ